MYPIVPNGFADHEIPMKNGYISLGIYPTCSGPNPYWYLDRSLLLIIIPITTKNWHFSIVMFVYQRVISYITTLFGPWHTPVDPRGILSFKTSLRFAPRRVRRVACAPGATSQRVALRRNVEPWLQRICSGGFNLGKKGNLNIVCMYFIDLIDFC